MTQAKPALALPLDALANLAHFHREHEKYYSLAPIRDAEEILRASQTLKALADRWSTVESHPLDGPEPPYTGCEDLNDQAAIETSGVLFMEGGGEPAELLRLKADLRSRAATSEQTGSWLSDAMHISWQSAGALVHVTPLADLLGERHRIIANNLQAADMARLGAALMNRAADILDAVDLTPRRPARRPGRTPLQPRLPLLRGDAPRPRRRPGGDLDNLDPRQRTSLARLASTHRNPARLDVTRPAASCPRPAVSHARGRSRGTR